MGFSVINEVINDKYNLVKFDFDETFTKEDFSKFLGILTNLLDIADKTNKPFGFYVDAHKSYIAPINAAKNLLSWKQKENARIIKNKKLKASAIFMKNQHLINLISSVLKISPPASPNIITSDIEKARKFVLTNLEI